MKLEKTRRTGKGNCVHAEGKGGAFFCFEHGHVPLQEDAC